VNADLVDRLHSRAESYRSGGPSAEHTAALLDEAAVALASAEASADYNDAIAEPLRKRIELLTAALSSAVGYMRNAKIDLETGATKATAIQTISGGIARAEAVLSERQKGGAE
jgi:hypothetical protein